MDQTPISPKRLTRSTTNRIIAGICGGLAEYFNVDPTLVRVVFAFTIFGGFGIPLYIILWILIPEAGRPAAETMEMRVKQFGQDVAAVAKPSAAGNDRRNLLAFIVIAFGVFLLLREIFPWHWLSLNFFWPVLIIIFGAALIFRR